MYLYKYKFQILQQTNFKILKCCRSMLGNCLTHVIQSHSKLTSFHVLTYPSFPVKTSDNLAIPQISQTLTINCLNISHIIPILKHSSVAIMLGKHNKHNHVAFDPIKKVNFFPCSNSSFILNQNLKQHRNITINKR